VVNTSVGVKADHGKPDLSLNPKRAAEEQARAFMFGEKKYGRLNYRKGLDPLRYLAAALRHISEYVDWADCDRAGLPTSSTEYDKESGVHHLGCALASISIALVNTEEKDTP
jgi:hypothetical protein